MTTAVRRAALILLFASSLARAGSCDGWPGSDVPPEAVRYVRHHEVHEAVDGPIDAIDEVRVWPASEDTVCFHAIATFSNLHYCQMQGEAVLLNQNTYEYRDGRCHLALAIRGDGLVVHVEDPQDARRNECNPLFRGEDICGANTSIPGGRFQRVR